MMLALELAMAENMEQDLARLNDRLMDLLGFILSFDQFFKWVLKIECNELI